MNNTIVLAATLLLSLTASAKTLTSKAVEVNPANISQVITLAKANSDGTFKKVQITDFDSGASTDFSPTHTIYLSFSAFNEMGNLTTTIEITDEAFGLKSATRVSAGVYEITLSEFHPSNDRLQDVTYIIDARRMFHDEKAVRAACKDVFCDMEFKTSVEMTKK